MNEKNNELSEIIKDLEQKLDLVTKRNAQLEEEIKNLKYQQASIVTSSEVQGERATNFLLRKLDSLKNERDNLALKIEQEEEFLTNKLQMKLNKVLKEKIDLENQLEQEEEYIVNKLQKQLSKLFEEKGSLEIQLEEVRRGCAKYAETQDQLSREINEN